MPKVCTEVCIQRKYIIFAMRHQNENFKYCHYTTFFLVMRRYAQKSGFRAFLFVLAVFMTNHRIFFIKCNYCVAETQVQNCTFHGS